MTYQEIYEELIRFGFSVDFLDKLSVFGLVSLSELINKN